MTTNATTKGDWRAWLRRVFKPIPFWQQRPVEKGGFLDTLKSMFLWALHVAGVYLMGGLVIATVSVLLIGGVFFTPGFFQYGLADSIGRAFAAQCLASGLCDLRYLMGGAVVGVLSIVLLLEVVHAGTLGAEQPDDEPSNEEVLDSIVSLDERIVHLRADLVLAGVLKVSPEEKAEVEDAPALPPMPITYTRPELTREHQADAGKLAVQLTANKSTMQLRAAVAMVLLENQRLLLEANEHRAARGLDPLPTFEAK